jgi:hypothetical protein
MRKPNTGREHPDFLRFRPLHAFTAPPDRARREGQKSLWRILWIIGLIVLVSVSALIFAKL